MVRIPLIGVPQTAWERFTGMFNASPALILWRAILVVGFVALTWGLFVISGGSAFVGIILGFLVTSLLSAFFRDDFLAVWADLWNARWAEVKV